MSAIGGRHARPIVRAKGTYRRCNSVICILLLPTRDHGPRRTRVGVLAFECLFARGICPRAVDIHLVGFHVFSPIENPSEVRGFKCFAQDHVSGFFRDHHHRCIGVA